MTEVFGKEDLLTQIQLAMNLSLPGRFNEAEAVHLSALTTAKNRLGKEQPHPGHAARTLTLVYRKQKQLDEYKVL